jgi:membrane protease YdiL (CAAX protease family)
MFSLAHLFFQNWIALALCAAVGLAFGWAYKMRGSLWFASLLHTIGGCAVFTVGLGSYLYHVAI